MSPSENHGSPPPANTAYSLPVELANYEKRAVKMTQEAFAKRFPQPFLVLARTKSLVAAIDAVRKQAFDINSTAVAAVSIAEAALAYVCPIAARAGAAKQAAVSLGRNPDNDIPVPVASVSGVQLQFAAPTAPGLPWLARDMGSKNGTFLDGVRMIPGQPYELRSGAQLDIARDVSGSFWESTELWVVLRDPSRLQELVSSRPQQTPEQW